MDGRMKKMGFENILVKMNNATSHNGESIGVEIVPEWPYSPDLNIRDRVFVPKFRNTGDQRRRGDDDLHKAFLYIIEIMLLHKLKKL